MFPNAASAAISGFAFGSLRSVAAVVRRFFGGAPRRTCRPRRARPVGAERSGEQSRVPATHNRVQSDKLTGDATRPVHISNTGNYQEPASLASHMKLTELQMCFMTMREMTNSAIPAYFVNIVTGPRIP